MTELTSNGSNVNRFGQIDGVDETNCTIASKTSEISSLVRAYNTHMVIYTSLFEKWNIGIMTRPHTYRKTTKFQSQNRNMVHKINKNSFSGKLQKTNSKITRRGQTLVLGQEFLNATSMRRHERSYSTKTQKMSAQKAVFEKLRVPW